MSETTSTPAKYKVHCANCDERFDAMAAPWCSCIGNDRSLKCPHCGSCFCKASQTYKSEFWKLAPPEMWERRRNEQKETPKFTNPDVDEIARPMVLIVEDDRVVQAIAVRVIRTMGYGVALANNGEEGLRLAREYRPELVLTDAMMPKLDGREMGRLIKNDEKLHAKVIVITSLYTGSRYRTEGLGTFKADAFLTKPLDADELRAKLLEYLGEPKGKAATSS